MNIEEVRNFALEIDGVTEDMFAEDWLSFRIDGKWFLLIQLNAPEPRVAVKLPPDMGEVLREEYDAVQPAYHMNKKHWNDLYIERLDAHFIKQQILTSYHLVMNKARRGKNQSAKNNGAL